MSKNNVTFGFQLANHPNRHGLYPVMMRITIERKSTRVKTDLEVKEKDWNQKAKNYKHFRTSCTDYAINNDRLMTILSTYRDAHSVAKESGNISATRIIDIANGVCEEEKQENTSFFRFAKERTQEIYDARQIRNWKKYNGLCNKLEAYMKSKNIEDIAFEDVTTDFLNSFLTFFHTLPNQRDKKKKLNINTIHWNFCVLKTLVNRAIKLGKIPLTQDPFMNFTDFPREKKSIKEKLNQKELDAMLNLDLQEGSWLWHARNYFFFSFYCCGIRVGDLLQLRWSNITSDGRLIYKMNKNGKMRDLKLIPEALEILKHYKKGNLNPHHFVFSLLTQDSPWGKSKSNEELSDLSSDIQKVMFEEIGSKTALINKYLAKVAAMAGIKKKVSMHIARHSFAKMAKDKGIDNLQVKSLLAHTNLSTTEQYMGNFDTTSTDEALESIFARGNEKERLVQELKSLNSEALKEVLMAFA